MIIFLFNTVFVCVFESMTLLKATPLMCWFLWYCSVELVVENPPYSKSWQICSSRKYRLHPRTRCFVPVRWIVVLVELLYSLLNPTSLSLGNPTNKEDCFFRNYYFLAFTSLNKWVHFANSKPILPVALFLLTLLIAQFPLQVRLVLENPPYSKNW